jgi:hypothetical protein
MDTSGLNRHLATQAGERNRELASKMLRGKTLSVAHREAAIEQLATIPEAWLDRLADENLAYVGLAYGETLADTELLPNYRPETLQRDAQAAGPLRTQVEAEVEAEIATLRQADPESTQAAFAEIGRADAVAERLSSKLQAENIGFEVRVQRGSTPLEYLHNEFNIADDPDHEYLYPDGSNEEARETHLFDSLLTELNGEGVISDGMVDPASDVLLIPYKLRGDKRVSPVSEESYASVTGQQLDNHHGMNIWPNRLIVVDDEVVPLPNRKMGYHSVLLHESGHAIDYAAEQIPELKHRETVDALYQRDMERVKKGEAGQQVFLTSRAADNVREYFAEAVEAYLTSELPTSQANFYKQENNHQALQERNPELYAYVDQLMRWTGSAA